ncbi:MAG: thioredoxin domain-containing protein [Sumerlaeia bacterium]
MDASATARLPLPSPDEIRQLPPDGGPRFNRLVFEKSPYLLQHAANPVDWRPWGDEAFAEARRRDVPVFLSVGYATCHWCHVMEHESFEDGEVAALMNERFVCIKVDREERPDIDSVYMAVTQLLTHQGGWPMTIVMTPEKEPFFAGTYFPKQSRMARIGMVDLLPQLAQAWIEQKDDIAKSAASIQNALQRMTAGAPGDLPGEAELRQAYEQLNYQFDAHFGGFGSSPKFPVPHNLSFLLRHFRRTGDDTALHMVKQTLQAMSRGGIYDHVGFGFHRYSTDEHWLLPHFEKMLYDNALLAIAYTEYYQITADQDASRVAQELLTYVLRDMTLPEGGFASAEDADSEGVEGKFYVWTPEEIREVLGQDDADFFCAVFHIVDGGNFHDEATGRKSGENIPHLRQPLEEIAEKHELSIGALRQRIAGCRERLFAHRDRRVHPLKDDKVLTDWNGLMIAALSRASRGIGDQSYAEHARRAADFLLSHLRTPAGRLLKRWREGEAGLPGHLEDYAFTVWGLIELYEATFEVRWLREASALSDAMIHHFHDAERGGFFQTADDSEKLLVRGKDAYDGAIPSGNGVAALALYRLGRMLGREDLEDVAEGTIKAFGGSLKERGVGHTMMLQAVDFAAGPTREIVVAGDPEHPQFAAMADFVRRKFYPNTVVVHRPADDNAEIIALAPYLKEMRPREGRPTVYFCENFACQQPIVAMDQLVSTMQKLAPRPAKR